MILADFDIANSTIAICTVLTLVGGVVVAVVAWSFKQDKKIAANITAIEQLRKDNHAIRGTLQTNQSGSEKDDDRFHELNETVRSGFAAMQESMKSHIRESEQAWKKIDAHTKEFSEMQKEVYTQKARVDLLMDSHMHAANK